MFWIMNRETLDYLTTTLLDLPFRVVDASGSGKMLKLVVGYKLQIEVDPGDIINL